jgi:hypothetical protein
LNFKTDLNPHNVTLILKHCLFTEKELAEGGKPPKDAVVVKGVSGYFGFHRERLNEQKLNIKRFLKQFGDKFRRDIPGGGGGASFLEFCHDKNGTIWTGLHLSMDELLCLGLAAGYMGFCMPRENWVMLPGQMPYIYIDLSKR